MAIDSRRQSSATRFGGISAFNSAFATSRSYCSSAAWLSAESIRRWTDKFGAGFAHQVRTARRKPGSTWPAKTEIPELANVKHVFVKACARVNNRAENSHQPTRERERRMRGFRLPERTQSSAERLALSQTARRAI
ncbi:transposase-like protein [Paraburkholderia sp. CI2]|nr:transposase-like protein [Paraburkholderia sp. CI2]